MELTLTPYQMFKGSLYWRFSVPFLCEEVPQNTNRHKIIAKQPALSSSSG